jgi:DNA primase
LNLEILDTEQLVSYLGYEYRVGNGKNGVQLNLRLCPNCGRQEYKVYLNADTGLGNCFQCNIGLNKYKLIKLTLGLATHGAVCRYVDSVSTVVTYRPKVHPDAYKLNTDWKLPLNKRIELEEDLPQYLKDRGINAKLAKRFDIRICENGFYKYQDFNERSHFVDFSNRIILPVHDIDGELVTFQGRDTTGTSEKKYLFPNMLPGTARFIYNAHLALKNKAKKVVLSEGCFDVFATTEALESDVGYKDFAACGTFGKHLSIAATNVNSADQLTDLYKLKEGGVEEFIVLWDGERKAIAAAIEAALNLTGYGFNATVARLSDGNDPAEATREEVLRAIDMRTKPTKFDLMRMRLSADECS